jgi:hypothetical protein
MSRAIAIGLMAALALLVSGVRAPSAEAKPCGDVRVGRSRPGHGGCNEKGGDAFFVFYPPD